MFKFFKGLLNLQTQVNTMSAQLNALVSLVQTQTTEITDLQTQTAALIAGQNAAIAAAESVDLTDVTASVQANNVALGVLKNTIVQATPAS